jgi:phosphohistidine phosphatase
MMDIYIIRHGAAVELDNEIAEEGFRYLSQEGRKRTEEVAIKLKELHTHFDLILSSPLVRAVQTAEIIAAVLEYESEIKTAIEMKGGNSFVRFQQLLKRHSQNKSIAAIGHAPDVHHYMLNLLSRDSSLELKVHFHSSSVCKIRYDPKSESGRFVWFLGSDTMELTLPG